MRSARCRVTGSTRFGGIIPANDSLSAHRPAQPITAGSDSSGSGPRIDLRRFLSEGQCATCQLDAAFCQPNTPAEPRRSRATGEPSSGAPLRLWDPTCRPVERASRPVRRASHRPRHVRRLRLTAEDAHRHPLVGARRYRRLDVARASRGAADDRAERTVGHQPDSPRSGCVPGPPHPRRSRRAQPRPAVLHLARRHGRQAADRSRPARRRSWRAGAPPDRRRGRIAGRSTLLLLDAHPNIEVRLFNPIASRSARALWMITDFSRVNRRMHNKSFTADNQLTIVGGRNIGDEYFEAGTAMNYADLDALAIGAAVAAVSARFDRYWNSPVVYGISELRHEHACARRARTRGGRAACVRTAAATDALRPGDARQPALAGAARRPRLLQPRAHRGHGGRSRQSGARGEGSRPTT